MDIGKTLLGYREQIAQPGPHQDVGEVLHIAICRESKWITFFWTWLCSQGFVAYLFNIVIAIVRSRKTVLPSLQILATVLDPTDTLAHCRGNCVSGPKCTQQTQQIS